jgi:hypothetical protein
MDGKGLSDLPDAIEAANSAVSDLIYTVVYELSNNLVEKGLPESIVFEEASALISKYNEEGMKIRKKPAPRKKKDGVEAKKGNFVWLVHPNERKYSYTKDIPLARGYPLRDNSTGKIVGVITDDDCEALDSVDIKVVLSHGLEVELATNL